MEFSYLSTLKSYEGGKGKKGRMIFSAIYLLMRISDRKEVEGRERSARRYLLAVFAVMKKEGRPQTTIVDLKRKGGKKEKSAFSLLSTRAGKKRRSISLTFKSHSRNAEGERGGG